MSEVHTGTCFCGAVEVQVTGTPEAMGYCHCRSRRSWSAGPLNAFSLCGHLMIDHPPLGLTDVYAVTLPDLALVPGVHVNCAETVLPMKDGLPKFKDFPADFGGSGETVAV